MKRMGVFIGSMSLLLVLLSSLPATAASGAGKLAAMISWDPSNDGPTGYPPVDCGGSNTINPGLNMKTVGVSYVCEKERVGTTTWSVVGSAPATSCSGCSGTAYAQKKSTCHDFGDGTWDLRARVDGWWIDNSGVRHDMTLIRSSNTLRMVCYEGVANTTAKLAAMVSLSGSTSGSGPTINCGGSNSADVWTQLNGILVSYVCQYSFPAGTPSWTNVTTAPSYLATWPYGGTGYKQMAMNCSFFPSGTAWLVRSYVDGYWKEWNGTRHDQTAIASAPITVTC